MQFHDQVGQVAANDINNIHFHVSEPHPPDDPENSVECPQCHKKTWRYSRYCIHCALDVFAWRTAEQRDRARRKVQRIAGGFAVGAAACAIGALFVHPPYQTFGVLGAFVLGGLAVELMDAVWRSARRSH